MIPKVPVAPADLHRFATEVGLDQVGVSPVSSPDHQQFYLQWLKRGLHGEMHYMESHAQLRCHPEKLLRGAESILSFAWNYHPADLDNNAAAKIARYARGKDYHPLFKTRLHAFWDKVTNQVATKGVRARFFTDSAPLLERDLAARAGIGWIGKNCCLIHPKLGSWLFLGEIITNLALEIGTPLPDRCGSCTACLDACPTKALVAPYTLDANLCIAYLTIEKRGPFDEVQSRMIDEHVFGCDICQEVCPWNRRSPLGSFFEGGIHHELKAPGLEPLHCDDEATFSRRFADSPISRTTQSGWQRNLKTVDKNRRLKRASAP